MFCTGKYKNKCNIQGVAKTHKKKNACFQEIKFTTNFYWIRLLTNNILENIRK